MKRKLDFVTNSSSVSFCAWGQNIDESFEELTEKTQKLIYQTYVDECKKYKKDAVTFEEFDNSNDWKEYLMYILEENGFDCSSGPEGCDLLVGINPGFMPEDMTLREFKDSIRKKFSDLGLPTSVYLIEEGWVDN